MDTYESCRKELSNLCDWYKTNKGDRNEATTRFHLIDALLLDCLNWERQNIATEDLYEKKYTDFTLKLTRPILIIEAKKEGNYLELPEGNKKTIYSLKSLCKDNKEIHKALTQVSEYCQKRGIQIAAVTNGWQFIVFVANRTDSIPPLEGNAFVFTSLEMMLENFQEFWNVLSKKGLEGLYLIKKLMGDVIPDLPAKLSSTDSNYPGIKNRNPFQTDLQIISELVLEDIIKDSAVEEDFLRSCYCKSGALSQYALVSKEILKSRYEYLFEKDNQKALPTDAVTKKGVSGDLLEIFANSLSRRPILLVGDVGVGKTTFINNLMCVEAKQYFLNSLTFKIDLGSKAVLAQDIREAIVDEIIEQLLKKYSIDIFNDNFVRGTYHFELERFRNGIHKKLFESSDPRAIEEEIKFLESKINNKSQHLMKSLQHISKGRGHQVVIFIDNCDQRDDLSQQTAFLIAHEVAENWTAIVFVSLRPETFHRSIKSGALSGYHPKAFTISPPRIDDVIAKRLNFAQKITRGELPLSEIKISTTFEKLDKLIEVIKMSFSYNDDLYKCIENISLGNIRQAVDLLKSFLGSGHIDTEKILKIYEENGKYFIPIHEFLRAIIYGDNIYYNPNSSIISNIFDVSFYDPKEHFIMPILLGILHSQAISSKNQGFLEVEKLFSQMQGLGFTVNQIDMAVNVAYSKKLIETSGKGSLIEKDKYPSMLRISTHGVYHITNLTTIFPYIDAVIVDTPIFDPIAKSKINNIHDIKSRLDRALIFIDYLDNIWIDFEKKKTFFNWTEKSECLKQDINKIKERISN